MPSQPQPPAQTQVKQTHAKSTPATTGDIHMANSAGDNPNKRHCPDDEREPSPEGATIDERNSRPVRQLPVKRTNPFIWPDPYDMTDLPTHFEENPHMQSTQQSPDPPTEPAINAPHFPKTPFPRIIIPLERLTANLDTVLVDQVNENPDRFLAVVPFGAGSKLYADNPTINTQILAFLVSLGIQENALPLSLAKARYRAKPNGKSDFQTPWTLLLTGFSEDLRTYLLWQQTFSVSTSIAFSVIPLDKEIRSWVIMNISGDAVKDNVDIKTRALGLIKSTLWQNTRFRTAANNALAASGIHGSADERTLRATESFALTFIASNNAKGDFAPIWQLTGKPLTTDPILQKAVINAIRAPRYWIDTHLMEIDKRLVECAWCKADTHPAHACPLPKSTDWKGPIPDTSKKAKNASSENAGRGGRGRGSGRGRGRGGRGRGNGQGDRQGWQYVPYRN